MKLSLKIIIIVKKTPTLKPHKNFSTETTASFGKWASRHSHNIKEYPLPGFSSADREHLLYQTHLDRTIPAQAVLCSKPSDCSGLPGSPSSIAVPQFPTGGKPWRNSSGFMNHSGHAEQRAWGWRKNSHMPITLL